MNKKNTFLLFLFFVLFFFLPYILTFTSSKPRVGLFVGFYLCDLAIVFLVLQKSSRKIDKMKLKIGDIEEQSNVLNDKISREKKNQTSLKEKISRYASLERIIEKLNSSLSVDEICDELSRIVFSMISGNRGACIFYLVDQQANSLKLFKTKKEDKIGVIKAKQGDIFDQWVLRHSSPLLIEDIAKDFRFDLEKVRKADLRDVSSLISSPLVSGNKLQGVLRLDMDKPNYFTQEDLRFLVTICDLGAVALENGLLYQHTQELAIHDGLTGLFTKGHFLELLKTEISSSLRHERKFALLMMDIDFFKEYNDKFGHVAGDIVLKSLSSTIGGIVKDSLGAVCRFGGEEFCAILPGLKRESAREIAEEIRKRVKELNVVLRRQETRVTVSIGVAAFPGDGLDHTELIMKADKAMYTAKASGRDRVVEAE